MTEEIVESFLWKSCRGDPHAARFTVERTNGEQIVAANALPLVSLKLIWPFESLSCYQLRPPARGWTQTFWPHLAHALGFGKRSQTIRLIGIAVY